MWFSYMSSVHIKEHRKCLKVLHLWGIDHYRVFVFVLGNTQLYYIQVYTSSNDNNNYNNMYLHVVFLYIYVYILKHQEWSLVKFRQQLMKSLFK